MSSTLPIAVIIEERCHQLGLKRTQLVQRMGYRNIAKGLRSLENVCSGQLERYPYLLRALPEALNVSEQEIANAVLATQAALKAESDARQEQEEALYRATFQPHAIILTENSRPSQIFVVALFGVEALLRIDVDLSQPRETWLSQAVAAIPERVLGFSRPVGVVMNYSPDDAVQYDLATHATKSLSAAKRVGRVHLEIGGKTLC